MAAGQTGWEELTATRTETNLELVPMYFPFPAGEHVPFSPVVFIQTDGFSTEAP
jgi:hypothetical protein